MPCEIPIHRYLVTRCLTVRNCLGCQITQWLTNGLTDWEQRPATLH